MVRHRVGDAPARRRREAVAGPKRVVPARRTGAFVRATIAVATRAAAAGARHVD
jgi:hypothetical protein